MFLQNISIIRNIKQKIQLHRTKILKPVCFMPINPLFQRKRRRLVRSTLAWCSRHLILTVTDPNLFPFVLLSINQSVKQLIPLQDYSTSPSMSSEGDTTLKAICYKPGSLQLLDQVLSFTCIKFSTLYFFSICLLV